MILTLHLFTLNITLGSFRFYFKKASVLPFTEGLMLFCIADLPALLFEIYFIIEKPLRQYNDTYFPLKQIDEKFHDVQITGIDLVFLIHT